MICISAVDYSKLLLSSCNHGQPHIKSSCCLRRLHLNSVSIRYQKPHIRRPRLRPFSIQYRGMQRPMQEDRSMRARRMRGVRADHSTDNLRILLVNHRPPLDPMSGKTLDARVVGANSTIELFQTKAGSGTMKHIRTYADPLMQTPNGVAWVNDHAFLFSNDHTTKVGLVCFLYSSIHVGLS